jgi:hypothetical protein
MTKNTDSDDVFDEEDLADGFEATDEIEEESDDLDEAADEEAAPEGDGDETDDTSEVAPVAIDDEDDLTIDQDVELALDEVMAKTMLLQSDSDDDEDVPAEPEEKGEVTDSVLPKQDDEFRCSSCRLLKKTSQLADRPKSLCRDCV